MSDEQMNSYRLTSMEEPGDERMARIMREVAEDARENTRTRGAYQSGRNHKQAPQWQQVNTAPC